MLERGEYADIHLTRKEQIAMHAMQAIITGSMQSFNMFTAMRDEAKKHNSTIEQGIAELAVRHADALLAELAKTGTPLSGAV